MKGLTQNKTVFSDFETLQSFVEIKAKNFIYLHKNIRNLHKYVENGSFVYNVHYVQYVQIYRICEQTTYNCLALKKVREYRCSYGISFWNVQKRFIIVDQAYGFHYC